MGAVVPSEAGTNGPVSEVDITYGILNGELINLTTGENLGDPSANGYFINSNGEWVSDSGVVAPDVTVPSAPTSPLAPGLDLSNLDINALAGSSNGLINAMKGVSSAISGGSGGGGQPGGQLGGQPGGGQNNGPGTPNQPGGGAGEEGGQPGGQPGGGGEGTTTPTTTTNPVVINPVVINPIITPITTKPSTTTGSTTTGGLTAQQLAILSTPTIFTPYTPGVDVNAPKVNLAGLAVQPVTENQTANSAYMPYLPDIPDLPYNYGAPQDAQAVTYASPNEGETNTMSTGGSVNDLLRLINWRI
jgi:hypothetical protein